MEVSGQLHTPAALRSGESPLYVLNRRLGGPQNRCGRGGVEKMIPAPAGNRTLVIQPSQYTD